MTSLQPLTGSQCNNTNDNNTNNLLLLQASPVASHANSNNCHLMNGSNNLSHDNSTHSSDSLSSSHLNQEHNNMSQMNGYQVNHFSYYRKYKKHLIFVFLTYHINLRLSFFSTELLRRLSATSHA